MGRISRRALVALAGALPAAAQQPAEVPPIPSTPDEELKAARAQYLANAEQLSKADLPMGAEPAVHFKA